MAVFLENVLTEYFSDQNLAKGTFNDLQFVILLRLVKIEQKYLL